MKRISVFSFIFLCTLFSILTIATPTAFAAVNNELQLDQFQTILGQTPFGYLKVDGKSISNSGMRTNSSPSDSVNFLKYRYTISSFTMTEASKFTIIFPLSILGSESVHFQAFIGSTESINSPISDARTKFNGIVLDSINVISPSGSILTLPKDNYSFGNSFGSFRYDTIASSSNPYFFIRCIDVFVEDFDINYVVFYFSFNSSSTTFNFTSINSFIFGLTSVGVSTSSNAVFDNILTSINQIPDKIDQSISAAESNGGLIIQYGGQIYNSLEDIKNQNDEVINNQATMIYITPEGQLAVDQLQDSFDETKKKIDEILESLKVFQPEPSDIIIGSITDISSDYDLAIINNVFGSLFGSNIILTLMIGSLSFCLIGYVLFGKKA